MLLKVSSQRTTKRCSTLARTKQKESKTMEEFIKSDTAIILYVAIIVFLPVTVKAAQVFCLWRESKKAK